MSWNTKASKTLASACVASTLSIATSSPVAIACAGEPADRHAVPVRLVDVAETEATDTVTTELNDSMLEGARPIRDVIMDRLGGHPDAVAEDESIMIPVKRDHG